jgi:adenylate cyclase
VAREIERKFLVDSGAWHPQSGRGVRMRQGYLSADPARIVRVRREGATAAIAVKGATVGIERVEYEYAVPPADADVMLDRLCLRPLIEKTRYREEWAGHTWEIDVFEGDNAGLVVAEVELASPHEPVTLPPWVGAEVSGDPRYYNARLIKHPFKDWNRDR